MKKYLTVLATFFVLVVVFVGVKLRKGEQIKDLLLINIESLAISESPNVECIGDGSLDCPKLYYKKVKIIII